MSAAFAILRAVGFKGIAAAVIFTLATGMIIAQGVRLRTAQDHLETARDDLATCRARGDSLAKSIEAQNAAIAELEAAGAAQAERARVAARAAAQARKDADARVRDALSAQVPADCPGAARWAAERAPGIVDRWAQ